MGDKYDVDSEEEYVPLSEKMASYMKIILQETDVIVFFEQPSITVIKGTEEAKLVEQDIIKYDYLTSEKGKFMF